jgi:hypothetical protein
MTIFIIGSIIFACVMAVITPPLQNANYIEKINLKEWQSGPR